jgi:hypothetical protein
MASASIMRNTIVAYLYFSSERPSPKEPLADLITPDVTIASVLVARLVFGPLFIHRA